MPKQPLQSCVKLKLNCEYFLYRVSAHPDNHPAVTFLLSCWQMNISILSCTAWSLWRLYLRCAAVGTFSDYLII